MATSLTDTLRRCVPTAPQAKRLGLTLALVLTIVASHFLLNGHDDQRLLQLGFLVIASALILASGRLASLVVPLSRPILWPLMVFFALGAVSSVLAFSPHFAFLEVLLLLLLLAVGLGVAREMAFDYQSSLTLVQNVLAVGAAVYLVQIAVAWTAAIVTRSQLDLTSMAPAFSNYRLFNHGQTISLPIFVLMCCNTIGPRRKWLLALAACWFGLMISLSGRGTMLGLGAGFAAALLLRRAHGAPFCRLMAQLSVAGALLYLLFCVWIPASVGLTPFGEFSEVIARTVAAPASLRGQLWQWCIEMMSAHPWLGVGPMHYAHDLAEVARAAHPHNWALQIGAEWGIPALVCVCLALGAASVALVSSAARIEDGDRVNQTLLTAWIVTGVAIVVDGFVSGNIVMPVSQLLIALYIGCAAGWVWSLGPAPASVASMPARMVTAAVLVAATAGLLVATAMDWPLSERPYQEIMHPRYWLSGHF